MSPPEHGAIATHRKDSMDLGTIIFAVLGIAVFAVIAGAVGQIMEGELVGGCGFLVLGAVLMAIYLGGAALFNVDAIPIDLNDIPGLGNAPDVTLPTTARI
jgi:hypothetical protein